MSYNSILNSESKIRAFRFMFPSRVRKFNPTAYCQALWQETSRSSAIGRSLHSTLE